MFLFLVRVGLCGQISKAQAKQFYVLLPKPKVGILIANKFKNTMQQYTRRTVDEYNFLLYENFYIIM
jgi:hypothetical protein